MLMPLSKHQCYPCAKYAQDGWIWIMMEAIGFIEAHMLPDVQ